MIRDQWYVMLESREVKNKPAGVKRLGENLVLYRDNSGKVNCFRDICPHRGAALSKGEIITDHLRCPFHGLEFEQSGKCVLIPANSREIPVDERFHLKKYETFESFGFIWIFYGEQGNIHSTPQFFDNITRKLSCISRKDPWNTHYSRCVENQLDVSHLPFVHRKTIGRGGQTVVDGPVIKWTNENKFHLYVNNRRENGIPPKKPAELSPGSDDRMHLEFIFPNLWQNYLSPSMRVLAAFVPVDEDNSIVYLRFYQSFIRIPLLRELFNRIFMPFNMRILHEDRRIVQTQVPKKTALVTGENLFQADLPIVQYRKRREELGKPAENRKS